MATTETGSKRKSGEAQFSLHLQLPNNIYFFNMLQVFHIKNFMYLRPLRLGTPKILRPDLRQPRLGQRQECGALGLPQLLKLLCAAIGLLIAAVAKGAIQATISPPVIGEMDSAQLILRVEGSGNAGELDVGPLRSAFEVLDISTASQINIINGQMRSWVEYRVQLRPKRAGALEIPALSIDGQSSPPLRLQVNPLGADVRAAIDRMIFFEVEVAPNPLHVQAQALLTRRLFYASGVQVYNDLPAAPAVPNALVVHLGDNNIGNVVRDGTAYGVLEQRYALFPEQSGVLRIPEISVMSAVRLPGQSGRRSGIRATAEAVEVRVLPIPAEYPADQPWLPAAAVTIDEAWAPAAPVFKVGEPLRRTLTLTAVGNVAASIPPLNLDLPTAFFKQYPEPERLEDSQGAAGVRGLRQEVHSIIPVQPGEALLPRLSLTWWDAVNGRLREAALPERRVRILGDAPALEPPPAASEAPPDADPRQGVAAPPPAKQPLPPWLLALAALGFAGWATTWLVLRRRAASPRQRDAEAAEQAKIRQARKTLAKACQGQDCEAMRNTWLNYLGAVWRTSPPDTLTRIKGASEAKDMLDRLNAALYADGAASAIDGQALLRLTRTLIEENAEEHSAILPELHGFADSASART